MDLIGLMVTIVVLHYFWANILTDGQRKSLRSEGEDMKSRAKDFLQKD